MVEEMDYIAEYFELLEEIEEEQTGVDVLFELDNAVDTIQEVEDQIHGLDSYAADAKAAIRKFVDYYRETYYHE